MIIWKGLAGLTSKVSSGGFRIFRSMSYVNKNKLEDIKKEFRVHEGGRITLSKNEETGIAYICLDHPEKKNGLSGNSIGYEMNI